MKLELLALSLPSLFAIVLSWMAVWYVKRLWRASHPDFSDRLRDHVVIMIALLIGGLLGAISSYLLHDYVESLIDTDLDYFKLALGTILVSSFGSPFFFGVLLWFVLVDVDLKVWHKPSWRNLYEWLNVPHRKDVDYTNGRSDLTRFKMNEGENK